MAAPGKIRTLFLSILVGLLVGGILVLLALLMNKNRLALLTGVMTVNGTLCRVVYYAEFNHGIKVRPCLKKIKKVLAPQRQFDIVHAPRRPKGRQDSMFAGR